MTLSFFCQPQQVLAILVLGHGSGQLAKLVGRYPPVAEGSVFKTGNLKPLALLNHFHEDGSLCQRVVRTGIQPGETAAQGLDLQFTIGQKGLVHGCNLKLATGRWLDALGNVHHLIGVEIQTHNGIVALGLLGLLLNRKAISLLVELRHPIPLRIRYPVAKYGGLASLRVCDCLFKQFNKAVAVEDVVSKHKANAVIADKLFTNKEGLCQAVGRKCPECPQASAR